jgi:two-component system sensor histidine kinase VanS
MPRRMCRGAECIRTDHAGIGLGLAIVKSITQAHDGILTPPLTPGTLAGSVSRCNYPPRYRSGASSTPRITDRLSGSHNAAAC